MSYKNSLTTKEVARLCRVSHATVKRWEDQGLLTSERTQGGHRRFRIEEVARFQSVNKLGVKKNPGDECVVKAKTRPPADKSLSDCSFFHSLIVGSEEEVSGRMIEEYLNGMSLPKIFDELISPRLQKIGKLWYQGQLSVVQEHLATQSILSGIRKLRDVMNVSEPKNKLAICSAVEGDFHELPTHFARMIFESKGWEVLNFGANTPLFAIADEITRHSPQIACISVTIMENIERTSREYDDFREKMSKRNTKIILGGSIFSDENVRRRFPAHLYPRSFTEVADFIK